MKKLLMLLLAVFVAVSFVGTAGAQDVTRTLSNAGQLQFFASPVTASGNSVYLLAGGPVAGATSGSGASLIAIDPRTATGTSAFLVTNTTGIFTAGSTAYGTPAVLTGETVFVQVYNSTNAVTTGTTVAAVNGINGTTYWQVNLIQAATGASPVGDAGFPVLALAGATPYAPPLTLDPSGTTVYALSGTSNIIGVSIFAIRTTTGVSATFQSGVSAVWAAPLVSGNSFYMLGEYRPNPATNLNVLVARDKNSGVSRASTVVGGTGGTPFATPVITGNSIFVVDRTGGVTAYSKDTLLRGTNDFIQIGPQASSAVTASPVATSRYLVVTQNNVLQNLAGVTVFDLTRPLAGATGASWWYSWTGATITATPAISNGVLYVALNETGFGGRIDRFNLGGHSGRVAAASDYPTIINDSTGVRLGFFDFSSPIIKSNRLILVSNGTIGAPTTPKLYSFDLGAGGTAAWPQFKFDAARTGENTAAQAAAPAPGDDSGCFISTIK